MDPALVARGVAPTLANTVDERFIGRLTPGSNRFNGAFQAGQGINDELQDGTAFRVSPRVGFVYDLTGKAETILRGGWGIFYDRPQGNMVFDMIANAPGVLSSTLQWGRLQELTAGGRRPEPDAVAEPDRRSTSSRRRSRSGTSASSASCAGTSCSTWRTWARSRRPAAAGADQRRAARRRRSWPQNQDPTRAPSATPGATALPNDLLRPYPGYGDIRMWDYSGYSNYHALQTGDQPPVRQRVHVLVLLRVEQGARHQQRRLLGGRCRTPTEEKMRRLDYSLLDYDRPHNFVTNFIYQMPSKATRRAGRAGQRLADLGRLPLDERPPVRRRLRIPDIGAANLTGNDGNPGARIVLTCDPGRGWSGDPYQQFEHVVLRAAAAGQRRRRVGALLRPRTADQQPRPVDLEDVRAAARNLRFEVRLDMFNALNHTQFTGVNADGELREPDRSHDHQPAVRRERQRSCGRTGFGAINGVAPPRTLQLVTRVTF